MAAPQLEKFSYVQDFETEDPVAFWATNGEHEVHFKGLREEQAFSGKKSFKLDVTLKSPGYRYYYWKIPCGSLPKVTSDSPDAYSLPKSPVHTSAWG